MILNPTAASLKAELKKVFPDYNVHQLPSIIKVVVAIGIGSLVTRKGLKDYSEIEKNLTAITGQKPHVLKSKKAVSNFKLREGLPVMLAVTLRGQSLYDFLYKLNTLILPRLRDFEGLSHKSFDGQGNITFGMQNFSLFPELHPDDITIPCGMQVTINMKSQVKDDAKKLLTTFGFIMKK